MKKLTIREAGDFFRTGDNFLLITHCRPDGDTVGSAAALCLGLRKMGKKANILENLELTPRYAPLHKGLTVSAPSGEETVVSVDVASEKMFPKNYTGKVDFRVDHHGTGTAFAECQWVEPDAAACGNMIFSLLQELEIPMDCAIAEAIYIAVSTDTGCFRYSNTDAHAFIVAAACARAGARIYEINQELFETESLNRLRLQGRLVENAKFYRDGKMVLCTIPYEWTREMGLTQDDTDNISGYPRTIAGVELASTIRENPDGSCKLSVRAIPGYDAAALCGTFGGGGHKGAAGATIVLPLAEAVKAVEAAMLAL